MRTVGAFEAKTHFSQLIDEIRRTGEPILVQRRGKNMAVLEPYERKADDSRQKRMQRVVEAFREVRAAQLSSVDETLEELIEEGRRE